MPLSKEEKPSSFSPLLFGTGWFLIFFFPLSLSLTFSILPAGFFARYRNLYLPDIGWSIALAGLLGFLEKWVSRHKRKGVFLLLALSFFFAQRSFTQAQFRFIAEVSRGSQFFFHLLAAPQMKEAETVYLIEFPEPWRRVHKDHLSSFFYAIHRREGKVFFLDALPKRKRAKGEVIVFYPGKK